MNFIPKAFIEWKKVKYLRQGETQNYDYEFWLNEPLASWDVYDYWERERVESMREHLQKGNVLFDIGTEQGWLDLAYANIVGPENMVLIEPTPEFWPNIEALWMKNFPMMFPRGFYDGLFSNITTDERLDRGGFSQWPRASRGDLIDRNSYKLIHEHGDVIPQMQLDRYVYLTGIIPTAITIDVEGAELLVLKGAEETLGSNALQVWVSIHPDLMKQNYDTEIGDVLEFMADLGYTADFLAEDHEQHWYFHKV